MPDIKDVYVSLTGNTDQFIAAFESASEAAEESADTISEAVDGLATDIEGATEDMTLEFEEFAGAVDTTADDVATSWTGLAAAVTTADTEISEDIATTATAVGISTEAISTAMDGAAAEVGIDGGLISSAMGGPAVAIAAATVAVLAGTAMIGSSWQSATDEIANYTGQSETYANNLGAVFQNLGATTESSSLEMIEAFAPISGQLQDLEGHILSQNEVYTFMAAAQNLANASGEKLIDITADLTTVMQATSTPISQINSLTDELFNISDKTATPISTLAGYFDKLHDQLGPVVEGPTGLATVGSLLLDMTEQHVPAGRAITQIGTAFENLINPLQTSTGGMNNAQIELTKLLGPTKAQAVQTQSLGITLQELLPAVDALPGPQQKLALAMLFGSSASDKLFDAMKAGTPALDAAHDKVTKVGTVIEASGNQMSTSTGQWNTFVAQLGTGAGSVVQDLAGLADKLPNILYFFSTTFPNIITQDVQVVEDLWYDVTHIGDGVPASKPGVQSSAKAPLPSLPTDIGIGGGTSNGSVPAGTAGGKTTTNAVQLGSYAAQATGANITVQNLQVTGVQNTADLWNQLRTYALNQSRGQGVSSNFGGTKGYI